MIGWGGNNGSTLTASILANTNNISWRTKQGIQFPNYIGSLTQASTLSIGKDASTGQQVYIPFHSILPMVKPNDLVIGGWDINGANLAEAMERAQVLDFDLQRQLVDSMEKMVPLPSLYYPDYIAANQQDRANNIIQGGSKMDHLNRIRADIKNFRLANGLDKVIVLWTANTERFSEVCMHITIY